MRILVTGSNGFIGKNLTIRLDELGIDFCTFTRKDTIQDLTSLVEDSDFVVHLAGENRPTDENSFEIVNTNLTSEICNIISATGRKIPIILASSTQATCNNPYGKSKLSAENIVKEFENSTGSPAYIYRLPGVFGKWCKPNYNSVVATFCHNVSRDIPIQIHDLSTKLRLVYIDDVVNEFISAIKGERNSKDNLSVEPEYKIELEDLASQIQLFKEGRRTLVSERVGGGFIRKLYATYISYFSPKQFAYAIPSYNDERGIFTEILKTKDSGQFSFFTAKPGITRGGHYHHTKSEKFLVVQGKAKFGFRHVVTNETYEIVVTSKELQIIETVPGWSHNITNIGTGDMIAILWANESFNPDNPDTIIHKV